MKAVHLSRVEITCVYQSKCALRGSEYKKQEHSNITIQREHSNGTVLAITVGVKF